CMRHSSSPPLGAPLVRRRNAAGPPPVLSSGLRLAAQLGHHIAFKALVAGLALDALGTILLLFGVHLRKGRVVKVEIGVSSKGMTINKMSTYGNHRMTYLHIETTTPRCKGMATLPPLLEAMAMPGRVEGVGEARGRDGTCL